MSKFNPQYIAQVMQRKSTVSQNSAASWKKIASAFEPLQAQFEKRKIAISGMSGSRKKQLAAFLEFASDVRSVADPFVPCIKGCNACCYQRVTISTLEAEYIGYKTGIRPRRVMPGAPVKPIGAFGKGTPCTFLSSSGECSIYDARPYTCRNYVTLDVDSLLCQADNIQLAAEKNPAATNVPMLAPGPLGSLYQEIVKADAINDIRTFFP